MGLGDDLLFLGKAEEIYKQTGKKITPLYGKGWSPLFENVEFLTKRGGLTVNARDTNKKSDVHVDYYEEKKETTNKGKRIKWRKFTPTPFRVRLTEKEIHSAKSILNNENLEKFCIVNPDYKSSFFAHNKNWGFEKYQQLTNELSKVIKVVRILPGGDYTEPSLENAMNIKCENIRVSIAIMSMSSFGVSYDGLLQHVFAGFEIPCVVIQGGLVDQSVISYKTNIHHTYEHPLTPCGSMYDCSHCEEANKAITVEHILHSCMRLINENDRISS